jgi:sterol desaturase/sphingolipid hydroxylase (fatty acid hydroxylase superfamily)
MVKKLPAWLVPAAVAGAMFAFFVAETRRPLRSRREARPRRTARNLAMAGLGAAAAAALQVPLLYPLTRRVDEENLGLLHQLPISLALRTVAGVLLLDYTLWWWHRMNHVVPFFWRFHLVHHVDLDLDSSTALRFHFGELSLSVFYRMAQIRLLGTNALATSIWQLLLLISIVFHHSNLRLPRSVERRLVGLIVTPGMHGIHHSDVRDDTNSNWSSLLSWWDYLHGTIRLDTAQREITIGVPAYADPAAVTLPKIIALPFRPQRNDWLVDV